MLSFIQANYQIGDAIEIKTSVGTFSGKIEFINPSIIVLRQDDGKICGIGAADVRSFTGEKDSPFVTPVLPAAAASVVSSTGGLPDATVAAEPEAVPYKVVGQLSAEQLRRIDPKLSKRNYFKSNAAKRERDNTTEFVDEGYYSDYNAQRTSQPYVPAKGRISYYNPDKRYGFIRDFRSENDLYFHIQQVADNRLYENLRRGAKVVYTETTNAQGFVALCVHLPHPVSTLLGMAEDLYGEKYYSLAKGLVDHILEVCPDHAEAKELAEEIEADMPAQQMEASGQSIGAPSILYTQAKRYYLAKDVEHAEEFYIKALEAGEKPESCVKDLLTLYVSKFKQTDDETLREEQRDKALRFLEEHRSLLADTLTTKQFLALNFYLPLQRYDDFLAVVDDILSDPVITQSTSKYTFFLWQKGIALNKLGRTEEALAVADKGLALVPHHAQLRKLRYIIEHPELLVTAAPAATDSAAESAAAEPVADQSAGSTLSVTW